MRIIVHLVDHLHPLDLAVGEVLFFVRARTLLIAHLCLATCYVENQGHMIWISNEKAIVFHFLSVVAFRMAGRFKCLLRRKY